MKKKVIVVGLDGLEPSIVEELLARGALPHLESIRRAGFYSRLKTTYPAQTPVAWSSFATGTNPGGHGIFDFIGRDPRSYQPESGLSRFEAPRNIFSQPRAVNRRGGTPFWQLLAEREIPSIILRCPCTFPPDEVKGRMLAGVGVPDLRGSYGTGTFYTQNHAERAKESERVVHLPSGEQFTTEVTGPRNPRVTPVADAACAIGVHVDRASRQLVLETGGDPAGVRLREGEWSAWVRLKFKLSMLQSVRGIVRFFARRLEAPVEFYASPVEFDPAEPLFPVSSPRSYSRDLCEQIGPYSTLGMAEDHNGLNNGRFDERAFLAQCDLVLGEREAMVFRELDRFEEGLFFVVFDTPDRVQHMLWRFRDPAHPLFEREADDAVVHAIEDHYRRYDALLGRVLEKTDDQTLLVVLSDHGFSGFRRAFHVNTWLCQNGLLALQNGRRPGQEPGEGFPGVDWGKTHAYAVGLGGIYLNLRGREEQGIVEEGAEAERVRGAIQEGLRRLPDPESGCIAVHTAARREELYSGPYAGAAPDLLVNCAPGYRVSWQTAVGGIPGALFEDNTRRWSGDHIIDPDCVPGVLFMNRGQAPSGPAITDLAPTILEFLGVPKGAAMEGRSLVG